MEAIKELLKEIAIKAHKDEASITLSPYTKSVISKEFFDEWGFEVEENPNEHGKILRIWEEGMGRSIYQNITPTCWLSILRHMAGFSDLESEGCKGVVIDSNLFYYLSDHPHWFRDIVRARSPYPTSRKVYDALYFDGVLVVEAPPVESYMGPHDASLLMNIRPALKCMWDDHRVLMQMDFRRTYADRHVVRFHDRSYENAFALRGSAVYNGNVALYKLDREEWVLEDNLKPEDIIRLKAVYNNLHTPVPLVGTKPVLAPVGQVIYCLGKYLKYERPTFRGAGLPLVRWKEIDKPQKVSRGTREKDVEQVGIEELVIRRRG